MHKLREPATEVDIVPVLTNTLIRTGKLAEGGYFAVYDKNEVNIYDGKKAKIIITEEAVLKGYRCPRKKLWRIPLVKDVQNENTDTIILNSKGGLQSLNTRYQVPTTKDVIYTLHFMIDGAPSTPKGIHHVYDLPSIKPVIRYLHAAAGFSTKRKWLKAIRNRSYLTWPLITLKNVNKLFPEYIMRNHSSPLAWNP